MPIVIIDIFSKLKRNIVKINEELVWYDHFDRDIRKFTGSNLKYETVYFIFNEEELEVNFPGYGWKDNKIIAIAEDNGYVKYDLDNNLKEIEKWFNDNRDEFNLELIEKDNKSFIVSFPEGLKEEIEDSIYSKRFSYEFL